MCVHPPEGLQTAHRTPQTLERPRTSRRTDSRRPTLIHPPDHSDRGGGAFAPLKRAGLEHLTLHDLRHTAASLAVSSGAHVKVVQKMLGHKSAAMTLDTYADLFDGDLDDIAERMAERAAPFAARAMRSLGLSA